MLCLSDGIPSRWRLAADFPPWLLFEHSSQPSPNHFVIIGDQDSSHLHPLPPIKPLVSLVHCRAAYSARNMTVTAEVQFSDHSTTSVGDARGRTTARAT